MTSPAEAMRETVERALGAATVSRVFGEPIERDGVTVIPVARVRSMWGAGGGPHDVGGIGGGGAVTAGPLGVYEIRQGAVRWVPAMDVGRIAMMGQLTAIVMLLVIRSVARSRRAR